MYAQAALNVSTLLYDNGIDQPLGLVAGRTVVACYDAGIRHQSRAIEQEGR